MKQLKGSEKQIAWAEKIRMNFFVVQDERANYLDAASSKEGVFARSIEKAKAEAKKDFDDEDWASDGFEFEPLWDAFVNFFGAQDEAKFWIDNRESLKEGLSCRFSFLMVCLSLKAAGSTNVPRYGLFAQIMKVLDSQNTTNSSHQVIAEYIVAIPFSAGEWGEMVDALDIDVETLDELGSSSAYFEDICEALELAPECELEELLQKLRARGIKCGDIVRADKDTPKNIEDFGELMIYHNHDGYGAGWNFLENSL